MAKRDEISSTEKLLDLIRDKGEKASKVFTEGQPTQASSKTRQARLIQKLPFKRKITVGVDIGNNDLKLAAMGQTGDKPELLDYVHIPYPSNISKNSPQFTRFLKSALDDFCSSSKKTELWSIISSAHVETRYIRIPKVEGKQIANAVYWTYKKEVNFNETHDIFDYEVLGDVVEEGNRRLEVIAYSAPRLQVQELKNLIFKTGYHLTGISMVPFALQNLLRHQWIAAEAKNICNLFIGSDWSRIAIFSEGKLILSRDIKSGMQSMVEAIREKIGESRSKSEKEISTEEAVTFEEGSKKQSYSDVDIAQKIFDQFIKGPSSIADDTEDEFNEAEVFTVIIPVLERIVCQVERTLQHFSLNFKSTDIEKILVSGETTTNKRILEYISTQVELPIEVIDPFGGGASISDHLPIPEPEAEKGVYAPVIGIALSNNETTPNFIHTYKDKERVATTARYSRAMFGGILVLIALCLGVYYWQNHMIDLKKKQSDQLQEQVNRFIPYVDQNLILQMISQVQLNQLTLEQYVRKYSCMALIGVVSNCTPSNIRLVSLKADFGGIIEKKGEKIKKNLLLEGIIFGDRLTFESSLAEYLVQLKKAPFFSRAGVQNRSVDILEDKEVLRFTAQLELI